MLFHPIHLLHYPHRDRVAARCVITQPSHVAGGGGMSGILGSSLVKSKGVTKMVGTIAGGMPTMVAAIAGVQLHHCGVLTVAATVWVAAPPPFAVLIDARGVAFLPTSTLCEARGGVFPPTTTPCWCTFGRSSPGVVFGWNGGKAVSCGMADAAQEA